MATKKHFARNARTLAASVVTLACLLGSTIAAFAGTATTAVTLEAYFTMPQQHTLDPLARFLEARRIDPETGVRYGITTCKGGSVVAFPFYEHGTIVNEKFRHIAEKKFWQRPGGKKTFWNADALDDPALEAGTMPLIITEGEIDALTAIDCGFPLAVSVPDGAPPLASNEGEKINTPPDDSTGKFEFLWNNRDRLKRVKRFILAVDNDAAGKRLEAELLRRLSPSRCLFVAYPEGCKDLNDVRIKRGPEGVTAVLNGAKPYPVRGLYRLSDYPELPPIPTYSTGWTTVDHHLKLFEGAFFVVTGIPGHGKSTWVLNMLLNLAERYGWRSAIFSAEMPTVPHLRDKLRRMIIRKAFTSLDHEQKTRADAFICDRFVFIDSDPTDDNGDDELTLDWIIERAKDAVLRDGVRVLLIDPWNEVEHARRRDESLTEYIGRSIRSLKGFAKEYQVAVIVVAHPTKDVGKDGKPRAPTPYDIDGSAHWFNKPDLIAIVHRDNDMPEATIRVAKVRFEDTGSKGMVRMAFDPETSRFETLTVNADV